MQLQFQPGLILIVHSGRAVRGLLPHRQCSLGRPSHPSRSDLREPIQGRKHSAPVDTIVMEKRRREANRSKTKWEGIECWKRNSVTSYRGLQAFCLPVREAKGESRVKGSTASLRGRRGVGERKQQGLTAQSCMGGEADSVEPALAMLAGQHALGTRRALLLHQEA